MAPVQSKLFPGKKLQQQSLIPVVATTPHGRASFMSLGRIVVENTTNNDNSQHFNLQGSNFSGATGVNIGSGTNTTSVSNNANTQGSVKDTNWYARRGLQR